MECILLQVGVGLLVFIGIVAGAAAFIATIVWATMKVQWPRLSCPQWLCTVGEWVCLAFICVTFGGGLGLAIWSLGGSLLPKFFHFCIG